MSWWVWMAAGLALGVLEIVLPAFVFLGFAIGAVATGILVGLAGGVWPLTQPWVYLVFAVLSLAAWMALRAGLGVRRGQVEVWDRDINED